MERKQKVHDGHDAQHAKRDVLNGPPGVCRGEGLESLRRERKIDVLMVVVVMIVVGDITI